MKLLVSSIIENSIFLVMIFSHLIIFLHSSIENAVIISVLHFTFSIAMGVLSSQLGTRVGIISILLFYILSLYYGSGWTLDAHAHYLSLSIQMYNVDKLNIVNTVTLSIYAMIFLLMARAIYIRFSLLRWLKIGCIIVVSISVFICLIRYELVFNREMKTTEFETIEIDNTEIRYRGIEEDSVRKMSQIILTLEKELSKLGVEQTKVYQYDRYYVSLLGKIYKTRPIPVLKEKDKISINLFSDALLNRKEKDIQIDLIERVYAQVEKYQKKISPQGYLQQFLSAVECDVKLKVLEDIKIEDKAYVEMLERKTDHIKRVPVDEQNIVMKIVVYMVEDCPQDLAKLYSILANEDISESSILLARLNKEFPEFMERSECKNLFQMK